MRQWNKQTIEEQLKLHKKQNKDDRYNYMSEQFNAIWYCWELEKYTIEKDKEIDRLNNIIKHIYKELREFNVCDNMGVSMQISYLEEYLEEKIEDIDFEYLQELKEGKKCGSYK